MAKADVIEQAMRGVVDAVHDTEVVFGALMEVGGDETPFSVLLLKGSSEALTARVYALLKVVREQALPLMTDLDRVARGGMGAMAPMGTKVADGQLISSRK